MARLAKEERDKLRARLDGIIDRHSRITHVMGIDESGTGAWAGSFYIAAVMVPRAWKGDGMRDSKATNKTQRISAFEKLEADVLVSMYAEGASPDEINEHGHGRAYTRAFDRLLKHFAAQKQVHPHNVAVVVDGVRKSSLHELLNAYGFFNSFFAPKADDFFPAVSAASIVAKFYRDIEMNLLDKKFPGYNFDLNAGYGTPEHIEALINLCPIPHVHRRQVRHGSEEGSGEEGREEVCEVSPRGEGGPQGCAEGEGADGRRRAALGSPRR